MGRGMGGSGSGSGSGRMAVGALLEGEKGVCCVGGQGANFVVIVGEKIVEDEA